MAKRFVIDVTTADNFVSVLVDGKPILNTAMQPSSQEFTGLIKDGVDHTVTVIGINNSGDPNHNPYDFSYRISLDYNGNDIGIGRERVASPHGTAFQTLYMFHEYTINFNPSKNKLTIRRNIDGARSVNEVLLDRVPKAEKR